VKQDDLDRAMSESREIRPSEGFTDSVMARVRLEAKAPPPLVFPWKRVAPGMATCIVLTIAAAVFAFSSGPSQSPAPQWLHQAITVTQSAALQWTGATLLASLLSYRLSMRLAGYRN